VFPVLLLLFICVPVIEIGLFIQVGDLLGLWPTIAIVLATAFAGAALVRSQGMQTLMSVQSRLQQGEMPAQQILEGVMLAVAGVLLLTPGFMTDAFGMLVLLPAPRAILAKWLMTRVKMNSFSAGAGFNQQSGFGGQGGFGDQGGFGHNPFQQGPSHSSEQDKNTYEGEYERKDDSNRLN
jgi:UPF0716 protein FxsA